MIADYTKEIKAYNIRPAKPRPGKCALMVIDMQEYFRPLASQILNNVLSIIEACRASGIHIVFTRHGHKDRSRDGGMLGKWWGDLIQYGTRAWKFVEEISPLETDVILEKNRYSAFWGTGIDTHFRSRKIEEIIITGVMTNCCCETTARDAFVRDYRVFFVSDATAAVNHELHMASLKNLAYGFAHVVSTDELSGYLTGSLPGSRSFQDGA
jgi:isochorismate hydrolase